MSALEKKLNAQQNRLSKVLREQYGQALEGLDEGATALEHKTSVEQRAALFDGYETTLRNGTTRGVTEEDVEAVGNFHRDLLVSHRYVSGEISNERLLANDKLDSFGVNNDVLHGLTIGAKTYRPGKEEGDQDTEFGFISRGFDLDEGSKAVDDHLKSLRKKLTGKKKADDGADDKAA